MPERAASGLKGRRRREPRDLEDLLLVKGLPIHKGLGEHVELLAVCNQESLGLLVAFAVDLEHLGINGLRCLLAERSRSTISA